MPGGGSDDAAHTTNHQKQNQNQSSTPDKDVAARVFFENMYKLLVDDCYVLRKTTGCHELAEFIYGVHRNPKAAAELYEANCLTRHNAKSCFRSGVLAFDGEGVARDSVRALARFRRACELGSAEGCNNAAMMFQRGVGCPADLDVAERLFLKACDQLLYTNACYNLSSFYLLGGVVPPAPPKLKPGETPPATRPPLPPANKELQNLPKALEYSLRGCEYGHPYACINASRMYLTGDGIPKDEVKGTYYRRQAEELLQIYVPSSPFAR
ncbi:hypothetical protein CAOG_02984 [Capsaspora owczarzaki ATCC 30864]|uniref:Cytochrome c oxidase assembly factor 7 n=1 Tax=Capsaspora owczarzaki (strain ATCC 30864) TaxID=595528 RepID=A0A0D2VNM0_CAPO3|nr:hypothetical protein CAOG_02984 [Capsaspora owczarzaki ATCC 30864]KJE91932.1 hypothetical protein CAOG_002984 [Capsaspora owczarzaki ATCC 30864]|eukprot:XP_004363823.1 hypothetical protein CAOG_02984 [Capsaspora owczarzaki ATCC 30864]